MGTVFQLRVIRNQCFVLCKGTVELISWHCTGTLRLVVYQSLRLSILRTRLRQLAVLCAELYFVVNDDDAMHNTAADLHNSMCVLSVQRSAFGFFSSARNN
jgi:hypothetical protein